MSHHLSNQFHKKKESNVFFLFPNKNYLTLEFFKKTQEVRGMYPKNDPKASVFVKMHSFVNNLSLKLKL